MEDNPLKPQQCLSNIRKSWWFSIRSTRFSGPCCWASWSGVYRRSLQVALGSAWHCQILQTFMAMEHQPRLCSELTSSCHALLHFTYLIEIPFQTYIDYLPCLLWFISFFRCNFEVSGFRPALSMGMRGAPRCWSHWSGATSMISSASEFRHRHPKLWSSFGWFPNVISHFDIFWCIFHIYIIYMFLVPDAQWSHRWGIFVHCRIPRAIVGCAARWPLDGFVGFVARF